MIWVFSSCHQSENDITTKKTTTESSAMRRYKIGENSLLTTDVQCAKFNGQHPFTQRFIISCFFFLFFPFSMLRLRVHFSAMRTLFIIFVLVSLYPSYQRSTTQNIMQNEARAQKQRKSKQKETVARVMN